MSYLLRLLGWQVTYNDLLASNALLAPALLSPPGPPLPADFVATLLATRPGRVYDAVIAREYAGLYFTAAEDQILDRLAQNLGDLEASSEKSRAWYAISQACLIKRPFSLFHRANLALRTAAVPRSFGNPVSWERPFAELLPRFLAQVEGAALAGWPPASVRRGDVSEIEGDFDLVYLDPPYLPARGAGVDYGDFYHFLEGMLDYQGWSARIDARRRHRPYRLPPNPWNDRAQVASLLRRLLERFSTSTLVLSYRSDGVPAPAELLALLQRVKPRAELVDLGRYRYVLSTNQQSRELLFVGR